MAQLLGLVFCFYSYCNAQEYYTDNLVKNPTFQGDAGWNISDKQGQQLKGNYTFGWMAGIITQQIGLAEAFKNVNAPLEVTGLRYGWQYHIWCNNSIGGYCENPKGPVDTLNATVRLTGIDSKTIYEKTHTYNTYTQLPQIELVTYRFTQSIMPTSLNRMDIIFVGKDEGYWAGWYGPRITNVHASLLYKPNYCAVDPTIDVTCPGYTEAYFQKQCSLSSLYNPNCPGYATAYLQQQCSLNALFNPSCPGYADAVFSQQCQINPLYNNQCPGYANAYLQEQCKSNPLYSQSCAGYDQAYQTQQCNLNQLYNSKCPGYTQALFEFNCKQNPLSNTGCPLYQVAYFDQQCKLNPLFSTNCPLYQQTFFTQQCNANPLHNVQCPGYQQAYFESQCKANGLYNINCTNYQDAYLKQQCGINQLYSTTCPGYESAYREKLLAESCSANPQSNPSCPGYKIPITTNNTIVSPGLEDPVQSIVTPKIVDDPIVNQQLTNSSVKIEEQSSPRNETLQRLERLQQTAKQSERIARSQTQGGATVTARPTKPVNQQPERVISQQDKQLEQMSNVPGFDVYTSQQLVDAQFYKVEQIYKQANIPDNQRAMRSLNQRSDILHQRMVDQQYRIQR